MKTLINDFKTNINDYDSYLTNSKDVNVSSSKKILLKNIYDTFQTYKILISPLNQLIIDSQFSPEQLWQQIELDNQISYSSLLKQISDFSKKLTSDELNKSLNFNICLETANYEKSDYLKEHTKLSSTDYDLDIDIDATNKTKDFPDLFPKFQNNYETHSNQDNKISSNDINFHQSEEKKKDDRICMGEDLDEDIGLGNKSSFELQQIKMRKIISNLESRNITEKKPWNMVGEVSSKNRPTNSLLEEYLDFNTTAIAKPKITEEYTNDIESVIIRRIKDSCYDDVVRKKSGDNKKFKPSSKIDSIFDDMTNQNGGTNKISLCEVYEKDYLDTKNKSSIIAGDEQQNLTQIHLDIKKDMKNLFFKLDALCNLRFKPILPEPEIRLIPNSRNNNNLSVIQSEEITPLVNSEASVLAPQEIKARSGDMKEKISRFIQKSTEDNVSKNDDAKKTAFKKDKKTNKKGKKNNLDKGSDKKKFNFVKQWQEINADSNPKTFKKDLRNNVHNANSKRIKL
ncbi:unnamed protein product [Gordionus sp. m RMFG-2023]